MITATSWFSALIQFGIKNNSWAATVIKWKQTHIESCGTGQILQKKVKQLDAELIQSERFYLCCQFSSNESCINLEFFFVAFAEIQQTQLMKPLFQLYFSLSNVWPCKL